VKLYCLGDAATVRGFGLAGVEGRAVSSATEADQALAELCARPDCAVLIVTEAVAATIPDALRRLRLARRPLTLELAGPLGTSGAKKTLARLAQEAVGIRLGE
jgi:vacuolar-type H+-ATPase subunit F/Vma7